MNSHETFLQGDHPLIILFQAGATIGAFLLFFYVRRYAQPLPQVVSLLAFGLLINLGARVMAAEWFFIADICEYFVAGCAIWGALYAVRHIQKVEDTKPNAVVYIPDKLQRAKWVIFAVVVAVVGFFGIYAYVEAYLGNKAASATTTTAAIKENTKVRAEQVQANCEADQDRDHIMAVVTEIKNGQSTLVSGMKSLSVAVNSNSKSLKNGQQVLGQTMVDKIAPFNDLVRSVDTTKHDVKVIKTKIQTEEQQQQLKPKEKKGFWRNLFGVTSPDADSSIYVMQQANYIDTTQYHSPR